MFNFCFLIPCTPWIWKYLYKPHYILLLIMSPQGHRENTLQLLDILELLALILSLPLIVQVSNSWTHSLVQNLPNYAACAPLFGLLLINFKTLRLMLLNCQRVNSLYHVPVVVITITCTSNIEKVESDSLMPHTNGVEDQKMLHTNGVEGQDALQET